MNTVRRPTFLVVAALVVATGAGAGVAFADDRQAPTESKAPAAHSHNEEAPVPPPQGSEAIDPTVARRLAPPAGMDHLAGAGEEYTFEEAVELASQMDAHEPAPDGITYFYGMTPDGTFGVIGECREGGLSDEMAASLRGAGIKDLSVVRNLECTPYFAESSSEG